MEHLWTDDSDPELGRQVEQLALNPRFRSWVLQPTPESEAHWANYLFLYPNEKEAVRQARALVVALQMPTYSLSEDTVSKRTEQLLHRIRAGQFADKSPLIRPLHPQRWRWAAAAALLVLGLGYWAYREQPQRLAEMAARQEYKRASLPHETAGTVTEEVTGDIERRVQLPDGSVVTLSPHSYLRYAHPFGQTSRTVALTGQAFFSITHNPQKPFFVFTDAVVTRVLGTSFTVKSRIGQPATVVVHTGRVSVYDRRTFQTETKLTTTGLVLTPNQQAVLQSADGTLVRSLVDQPLPLSTPAVPELDFENKPVADVINALVKTYGVAIAYDHELLGRCRVTVTLEKEPLYAQLDLLNKLLNGHYEVVDTTVHFYADGCR